MTTSSAAPPASADTTERAAWAPEAAHTQLLDRSDELRHLGAAADNTGRPAVIVVTGPPGVGRSRLLRAAAAVQETRGRVVLRAACRRGGRARKLGLAGDLIASAASVSGPSERAEPADRGALVQLPTLLQSAPVCVYVDDIHWADPESLEWLGDLRGRLTGQAARIVVSVSEWVPQLELLKSLLAGAGVKRISLRPLSAAAVSTIVESALGPADPAFTASFFERTRGNPKLTHDLIAELRHRGAHPDDTGTRVLHAAADDVLASFTRPILLGLPLKAVVLAHAVFLLGSAADTETVMRVSGLEDGAAPAAVRRLRQTGLLDQRGDLLELRYPAASGVVESILGADDVTASRLAAARILRARQETAERGAALLLTVAPQGQRWIAEHMTGAARQAMARRDVATAVKMLRRALTEAPGDAREGSIRESLASAEVVFDPVRAAARLGRLLGEAADPVDRVRLTDLLAEALLNDGRPADAIAAIDAELPTAGAANGPVLQALIARRYLLDIEEPGLRIADAYQPLTGMAAGELAGTRGGTSVALAAAMDLALAYRLQDAAAYLDGAIECARDGGRPAQWARASAQRAEVAFRAGDLAVATSRARDSLELTRWVMMPLQLTAAATLARALVEQAELEEAGAVLALVQSQDREDWRWGDVLHARGALRLAEGDRWGALDDLYACGKLQQAHGRHAAAHNEWRMLAALALADLGDEQEAVNVATEAHRLACSSGIPALAGAALRVLGVVSGDERQVRAAVTALEQSPARLELAKALTEQAACELRDRPAEARLTLRSASSLAGACGAHGLEPRLDQLMIWAGGKPRRPASGLRALTKRQLAVATRAARGLTNREIAEELVLTQRAVELHLTNAYRKLDIHSRSQLQRIVPEEAGGQQG
jgi:DNA-binding CsgD family transcriptional regulator